MKKGYFKNVVNEGYVFGEDMDSGKYVYVLIDVTPYEFDVYGIYSNMDVAHRALQSLKKEEGSDAARYELKRVPLDEEPGHNYIPNE